MTGATHLWLRAETKAGEARSALTPAVAGRLIDEGFAVTVETSSQRAIIDSDFAGVGCMMAKPGEWETSPKDTFILGLKELPEQGTPLPHRHIYFAHAYKNQKGWKEILGRFQAGGGELLDLEYLLDDSGKRVAAFGYWAGFAGAALAVMTWCGQVLGLQPPLSNVGVWADKALLVEDVEALLAKALSRTNCKPRIIVIGAGGRVGSGASTFAGELALEVTPWDMAETAPGGPFEEIAEHNIFVNCVLVNQPLPPFITEQMIDQPRRQLSVIADVSCDPFGDYNPIPLYSQCTDFERPAIRLRADPAPLDLIAIDNLPSMLPMEASIDFCGQLLPALLQLQNPTGQPWKQARTLFESHCKRMEKT